MSEYSIFDPQIGLDAWMKKPSDISSLNDALAMQSSNPLQGTSAGGIDSGEIGSVLSFAKKNFQDTTAGWIQGLDRDGIYKFLMGDSNSSIDWAVTTANTLTIVGAITATTGTIGGFEIGSDYLRDVANSFGIASTVTGSDDVRFWAGATFANRATAPLRIYESGVIFSTTVPIQTYTPSSGGTATLDLKTGNDHRITMPAGNVTIALSNVTVGQKFLISITQDSVGGRTVTWFSTIRWADGSAPTLTVTPDKRDTFGFICTGSGTYDAFILGLNI